MSFIAIGDDATFHSPFKLDTTQNVIHIHSKRVVCLLYFYTCNIIVASSLLFLTVTIIYLHCHEAHTFEIHFFYFGQASALRKRMSCRLAKRSKNAKDVSKSPEINNLPHFILGNAYVYFFIALR